MIEPILIVIPPGSRFVAKLINSAGDDFVILDIESPKFETNDDGTESDVECDLQWVVDVDAMIFSRSRKRYVMVDKI